jgi:hypothetical protein
MNWHSRQRLNPARSKADRITIAGEMKLTTIASDKHFATPLPADLPLPVFDMTFLVEVRTSESGKLSKLVLEPGRR